MKKETIESQLEAYFSVFALNQEYCNPSHKECFVAGWLAREAAMKQELELTEKQNVVDSEERCRCGSAEICYYH